MFLLVWLATEIVEVNGVVELAKVVEGADVAEAVVMVVVPTVPTTGLSEI